MAKGNGKSNGEALPDGFEPVDLGSGQTWAKVEKGLIISGTLLGRFAKRGRNNRKADGSPRYFYQIRVDKACKGMSGAGEEREVVDVMPGENICIDETKALESLAALSEPAGSYRVFLQTKDKIKLDNGQTMWTFNLGKQRVA